jgi:pyruvate carboxylase
VRVPRPLADHDLASWLMYPRVYLDYVTDRATYGDVSVLPTRAYFYGLAPGQEITVELERGKQLIIRLLTVSDVHDDGTRTVFFELNGQPRPVRVADRSQVAKRSPRRRAEPGQAGHVAAPMPGTVATVAVGPGHAVMRGEILLTLEAMKMETAVRAERDGRVAEVLARPGEQVDAKDLLLILE